VMHHFNVCFFNVFFSVQFLFDDEWCNGCGLKPEEFFLFKKKHLNRLNIFRLYVIPRTRSKFRRAWSGRDFPHVVNRIPSSQATDASALRPEDIVLLNTSSFKSK
jgi:hypothetical protein